MEQQILYRNATFSVRAPRFVVLIDKESPHWRSYVEGIIQSFTQMWGGEYFLIVPTDGKTIDNKFWEILEAYSPDKIGRYVPTLLDIEDADPAQYQKIRADYKGKWALESDEAFDKTWNREVSRAKIKSVEISEELAEELKNRLAPFHYEDHIVRENVCYGVPLGFPFTKVSDILEYANDKPRFMTIPKPLTHRELRLLASSRAGAVTPKFIDEIKMKSIEDSFHLLSFTDEEYILSLEGNEEDKAFSSFPGESSREILQTGFLRNLPFKLSMIELARYYRVDTHQAHEENLIVVIGDEVTDYCLYYCLSRIHGGVHWLPDNFLMRANSEINLKETHIYEEEEKFTDAKDLVASLIDLYFRKIRYGHEQKRINIVSTSLSDGNLQLRKEWMSAIYPIDQDEPLAKIIVLPLVELSVRCVGRVMEKNNYANQQDIIFQEGKSVGRLNTPKPKNFRYIDPSKHRWITSIEIKGYHPPVLPFLSKDIITSVLATHDTRVAVDGVVYLCPNIAYLGGDIDVNTVRPMIRLVDELEIFAKYFQYSGYSIELSDKGSYLKDAIERFGSLQTLAEFFRSKLHRDIFDQYRYTTNTANDDVAYHLDTEKRSYLSFAAFSKTLGDSEKAVTLIDELTAKDILRRGFILHCSRCRLAAWYAIGEVSRGFQCKRCDLVQSLAQRNWKTSEEPRWYYRLVETVYLFYDSSSYLTALALDKLRQQSIETFHYICEANIKNYPNRGEQKEIDILAISDGKLILGECKDCKPKAKDLGKYQWLQSKLKIKPAGFILATTEMTVSEEVNKKLATIGNANVLLRNDLMEG